MTDRIEPRRRLGRNWLFVTAGVRRMDFVSTAAQAAGVRSDDVTGPDRSYPLAPIRQAAMVRAREWGLSLSQVGRLFNRHHTTVLHAVEKARRGELEDALRAFDDAMSQRLPRGERR